MKDSDQQVEPPEVHDHERDSTRPKRKVVGKIGSAKVYQLNEPTSCLDCFKSIPAGSLVVIEHVSSDLCKIPVCMYFSKLDPSKLQLTSNVAESRTCPCQAFVTGEMKGRKKYAETIRALR
jgi:hypothetical protein